MKIHTTLLGYLYRQAFILNLIALTVGLGFVLLAPGVLGWRQFENQMFPFLLILFHSAYLTGGLGRAGDSSFAWLYSRGFSRDTLWLHQSLTVLLSVLTVWAPMALCVWTPIRSEIQSGYFQSAYYPVFADLDFYEPWRWLVGYLIFLPPFQYSWIRGSLPMRGLGSGKFIASAFKATAFTLMVFALYREIWAVGLIIAACLIAGATLSEVGRRAHRNLEVSK